PTRSSSDLVSAGKNAGFFLRQLSPFKIAFAGSLFSIIADGRPLLFGHDQIDQRMFRREHHVGGAVKRVRSRGEYPDFFVVDLKIDFRAFASADRISLEQLDSLRPSEAFKLITHSLRQSGNAQRPVAS